MAQAPVLSQPRRGLVGQGAATDDGLLTPRLGLGGQRLDLVEVLRADLAEGQAGERPELRLELRQQVRHGRSLARGLTASRP